MRKPLLWSSRQYEYIQLLFPIKFIQTPRTLGLHSLIPKRLPTCALNLSIIFSFKALILPSWKTSFSPMILFFSLLYLAGFKLTLYLIKLHAHFIKVRYNFKPLLGLIILHFPFYHFDLFQRILCQELQLSVYLSISKSPYLNMLPERGPCIEGPCIEKNTLYLYKLFLGLRAVAETQPLNRGSRCKIANPSDHFNKRIKEIGVEEVEAG